MQFVQKHGVKASQPATLSIQDGGGGPGSPIEAVQYSLGRHL